MPPAHASAGALRLAGTQLESNFKERSMPADIRFNRDLDFEYGVLETMRRPFGA